MNALRRLACNHRPVSAVLLALVLSLKLLVPGGYMPVKTADGIVLSICTGTGPVTSIAIPGRDLSGEGKDGDHGKHDTPCPYAGLSIPTLAGADPILLAIAILFIMVLGLRPIARPAPAARSYLRPPLRAPPVLA